LRFLRLLLALRGQESCDHLRRDPRHGAVCLWISDLDNSACRRDPTDM
jgi:hypothetical protein